MSVIGIGLDVVDVEGFVEQLGVPGSSLAAGAFTAGERADVHRARRDPADEGGADGRRLATRYAAKEAFIKAWSASRFGSPATMSSWQLSDVEVVCDAEGRPRLRLRGEVAHAVRAQLGDDWGAHVSLSHDGPVAAAVVVIEQGDRIAEGRR